MNIGIMYPTQTVHANFETLEHCYEVFITSLLNGKALNLRAHANQVREGCEVGRDRKVDSGKGELRP